MKRIGAYCDTPAKSRGERPFAQENDEIIYSSDTKTLKPFTPAFLDLEAAMLNPGEASPRPYNNLTLHFLTPTRLVYSGSLTIDLEFHVLVRQLLRRLSLLYYFHCNGDSSAGDFKGIIEKAKDVKVANKALHWYDWERYSTRQDEKLKMGGFVGEITFEGNIGPFMPLIRAGEILHIGKGTGFGLGKYEIKRN